MVTYSTCAGRATPSTDFKLVVINITIITAIRHLPHNASPAGRAILLNSLRATLPPLSNQALEVAGSILLAGQRAALRHLRNMPVLHIQGTYHLQR